MAQETINLPRNTTVASIAEAIIEQNSILKQHFVTGGDTIKIADWDTFRQMVRAGNIGQYFSVGDQISCKRGTDTIVWDIVHIGKDDIGYFATLQTHNVVNSLMLDNREALFYAQTELPAGNYYFTPVATNVDSGWNAYKTMTLQFTLTKAVPAGGQLCLSTDGTAQKAPTQIITYSSQTSTTPLETVAASTGTTGIDLSTLGTLNHIQKVIYGSNTWEKSAIRQWLNSAAAAGSVWVPKDTFDRPPSWVQSTAGFMNGLDNDFLAVVSTEKYRTLKNIISDGGSYVDLNDKFFLPSREQVNMSAQSTGSEGITWDYYTKFRADTGTGANNSEDANRLKYLLSGASAYWWLRSPSIGTACGACIVNVGGRLDGSYVCYPCGVAPACVIR